MFKHTNLPFGFVEIWQFKNDPWFTSCFRDRHLRLQKLEHGQVWPDGGVVEAYRNQRWCPWCNTLFSFYNSGVKRKREDDAFLNQRMKELTKMRGWMDEQMDECVTAAEETQMNTAAVNTSLVHAGWGGRQGRAHLVMWQERLWNQRL